MDRRMEVKKDLFSGRVSLKWLWENLVEIQAGA